MENKEVMLDNLKTIICELSVDDISIKSIEKIADILNVDHQELT
jgi:hypothetical protein